MAATCARANCIWPHALRWPEPPERVLHNQRLTAAEARRAARAARRPGLIEIRPGNAGDGVQALEPAAGLGEAVPPMESIATVQQDQGIAEDLDGFADPLDQVPEIDAEGFPRFRIRSPEKCLEMDIDEMPNPLYQEVEPEVRGEGSLEEIPVPLP
ncbi:hypothetical protein GHT06_013549 [Daphnia sinensis]|uniref:Uncharacterized protein n=1 Tax=Daphnia sinensis TaxID=1820382 RepID=A0AAD5PX40_9CRUS|nr:hypothetical protein GHT06_013549 [Daphnia sinensis]